jgi:3-oxoisoapionate decarboxylase
MKPISRREALAALATAGCATLLPPGAIGGAENPRRRTSMGIVIYAFGIHQKNRWSGKYNSLSPALALLEEAHRLGAAGIMADLGSDDAARLTELRRRAEEYGMYIEASIMPPKTAEDVSRFEAEVRMAKSAGASLARTVIMPGRRYEQFKSLQEFGDFENRGRQSLQWAAPVLARHQFRLAVENHKDERIPEKLETLKQIGSEFIGICVDVGNSFTLLEDPLQTVRAFAPMAMTVHIKDQAVRENEHGFWFADAALGEGFLDLAAIVKVLREANPRIHFGLETITRDPLDVPVLTPAFWATMPEVPASDLARTLNVVKAHAHAKPFPNVSGLPVPDQLTLELGNVERSIEYARRLELV